MVCVLEKVLRYMLFCRLMLRYCYTLTMDTVREYAPSGAGEAPYGSFAQAARFRDAHISEALHFSDESAFLEYYQVPHSRPWGYPDNGQWAPPGSETTPSLPLQVKVEVSEPLDMDSAPAEDLLEGMEEGTSSTDPVTHLEFGEGELARQSTQAAVMSEFTRLQTLSAPLEYPAEELPFTQLVSPSPKLWWGSPSPPRMMPWRPIALCSPSVWNIRKPASGIVTIGRPRSWIGLYRSMSGQE